MRIYNPLPQTFSLFKNGTVKILGHFGTLFSKKMGHLHLVFGTVFHIFV